MSYRQRLFLSPYMVFICILMTSVSAGAQRPSGGTRTSSGRAVATAPATTGVSGDAISVNPIRLQHAEDEGKISFHSETILVQVPVIVTDKAGNHLHELTKEDFHILENGKEQTISSIEELISTSTKLTVNPHPTGEFGNLVLDKQQTRSVVVIAIDTVNTPYLDQVYGRRELLKFLANSLDKGQIMALMLITSRGVEVVHGLTGDPAELIHILQKVSGRMPAMQTVDTDAQQNAASGDLPEPSVFAPNSPGGGGGNPQAMLDDFLTNGDVIYAQFQQENAIETTMNGFLRIAWSLAGIPGRKSLIWATGSFPFQMDSPAVVPGGYLSTLYERAMQALNDAEVSVYPVDVRGLVTTTTDITKSRAVKRNWFQQSSIDTLRDFADMTGGRAFYNTNDLATSFKRATDDSASYYLLGYYLDTHNNHSGWRQLKVKVGKKDVEVRSRTGFFVTNTTINPASSRQIDLRYALTSSIEGTGVPLTVKWLGVSGEGLKKKADFLVQLPPNSVTVEGGTQSHLNFDFAAAAFVNGTKTEQAAATLGKTITSPVSEAQMATLRANGIGFKNSIELGPGQYTVRVVIRDNITGKVGSVTSPLTVN
jgi:VWFA-related protein